MKIFECITYGIDYSEKPTTKLLDQARYVFFQNGLNYP